MISHGFNASRGANGRGRSGCFARSPFPGPCNGPAPEAAPLFATNAGSGERPSGPAPPETAPAHATIETCGAFIAELFPSTGESHFNPGKNHALQAGSGCDLQVWQDVRQCIRSENPELNLSPLGLEKISRRVETRSGSKAARKNPRPLGRHAVSAGCEATRAEFFNRRVAKKKERFREEAGPARS